MPLKSILFFSFLLASNCQTNCHTKAWWALQAYPKSVLEPFLLKIKENLTFDTSNPLTKFMKENEHPVYFEFNQQNNCQQNSLPPWLANATEQTFVEFKLQIPYLIRNTKAVMLKPLVYQNNVLDVSATNLVYGLPTYLAKMHSNFDHNTYSIAYKEGSIEVFFEPLTSTLIPFGLPSTANFSSFVDANKSPWLAFPLHHRTKCATNTYNFSETARIRPVNMTLKINGNIFQSIPNGLYTNPGNQPLGAWQIDVYTTISPTFECF